MSMLLRAQSVPPKTVVRLSLRDFEAEARALLEAARAEAEAVVSAAQTRAAQIEQAAREAGFAEGSRQGYADGKELGRREAIEQQAAALRHAVGALSRLDESIESVRCELEAAALRDVVRLAVAIAERVTKRFGLLDPQVLVENVREVMKLVVRAGSVRVAVHPSQRKVLNDVLPDLQAEWPTMRGFELLEDESVAPGGCRVWTSDGEIDADLQSQLDRIAARLLPSHPSPAESGDGGGGRGAP
jgi:flagellar assembly protein FliH